MMRRFIPIAIILIVLVIYQRWQEKSLPSDSKSSTPQKEVEGFNNSFKSDKKATVSKGIKKSFVSHSLRTESNNIKENPYGANHQVLFDDPLTQKMIFPLNKDIESIVTEDFKNRDLSEYVSKILTHNLTCLETGKCTIDSSLERSATIENRMMLEALMIYNSSVAHGYTSKKLKLKTLNKMLRWGDSQVKEIALYYLIKQHSEKISWEKTFTQFRGDEVLAIYKNVKDPNILEHANKFYANSSSNDLFYAVEGIERYVTDSQEVRQAINTLCPYVKKVKSKEIKTRLQYKLNNVSDAVLGNSNACL
jgi:hypothetical protein